MQKYVENKGNAPMYVGNTMIPPGEGKLVEVFEAPAPVAAPAGPNLVDLMGQLLAKAPKNILPELPGLTHEALDLMESQERGDKKRAGLLAAIDSERLSRANAKLQAKEQGAGKAPADPAAAREALAGALRDLPAATAALEAAQAALAKLPGNTGAAKRQAKADAVKSAQAALDQLHITIADLQASGAGGEQ